ncbi:MAG: universal stress protein [Acidobacteriota bacterium]
MKILLAVDGSQCSDLAVSEVARRPWPDGSELKLITIIEPLILPVSEPMALPGDYFEQAEQVAQEQAASVIEKAIVAIRTAHPEWTAITSEILRGNPKQVIVDEAEKWKADLIVVGSHGYKGFTRFWLGSVSQAVASHAHCSVEIVRRRHEE